MAVKNIADLNTAIASINDGGQNTAALVRMVLTDIMDSSRNKIDEPVTDGQDGADGAQGPQGDAGPQGPDGLSAYEVAVADGFVGNETAWLASLVGADGADGADGAQGPQGIQGPQGDAGADGTNGTNGTNGSDGLDGADGDSAYQVWLNEGNVGTEADFIIAITGADGADGSDGAQGPQGIQGPAGNDGMDGADGIDGLGVPAGGTTGQYLRKASNADNDTEWAALAGGGDVVGPASSVLNRLAVFADTTGKLLKSTANFLLSDTAQVSVNGAAFLRQFNVKGTGLQARMYFEGSAGDNPGIEFGNDATGTRRTLIRLNEAGTLGTELEFYTKPDSGSSAALNMVLDEDGNLSLPNGSLTLSGTVDGRDVDADGTKLDGIASGATANSSDAALLARGNHTGTQAASTISDFNSAVDARITASGAQANTINSDPSADGVTGSDQVTNVTSCTQAEFDAGTPNASTLYLITDA